MTPEEFVRAVLLAKGVNGGEAIFISEGPAGVWSAAFGAQIIVRQYDADPDTSLDGKRFWRRRIQVEVCSPSSRSALQVAEQAATALDYVGPHNPAPGLGQEPFAISVLSGPLRAGEQDGIHFVTVNVEVFYHE